jgi:hypothetical protein
MKFLASFPCEKVIIDQRGTPSIITVMQNAHIGPIAGVEGLQEIPPNAVLPLQWAIFSVLEPSADEVGSTFEQVYQVYWPNEEKFTEGRATFKPDDNWQYNSCQLLGFPAGQVGNVRIITWVDHEGHRITDIVEFNVRVKHGAPPQP